MSHKTEEAVRYDRQVRLWGKSTQLLLQHTHVAVVGIQGGAMCEVLKNLALAGVGSIAVIDNGANVTVEDCRATHLVRLEDVDCSPVTRASAVAKRLATINHFVRVSCVSAAEKVHGDSLRNIEQSGALMCCCVCSSVAAMNAAVEEWHNRATWIVLMFEFGEGAITLILKGSPHDATSSAPLRQLEHLIHSPSALALRPTQYQKAVLALHLCSSRAPSQGSAHGESGTLEKGPSAFADALAAAFEIRDALRLHSLSNEDVQQVLDTLFGQAGCSVYPTSVEATFSGGAVGQQLIAHIGSQQNGSDDNTSTSSQPQGMVPYTWMVSTCSPTMECLVGN